MFYSEFIFLKIEVEMAGGSQIIINDHGITIKTGGKIVYKEGQKKFKGCPLKKSDVAKDTHC